MRSRYPSIPFSKILRITALGVVVFGLGCDSLTAPGAPSRAGASAEAPAATSAQPAVAERFGDALSLSETTPLASIVGDPTKYANQTIRTEGEVVAVCQAKGCWMELGDPQGQAHVKFHGYSFFVPKDASGRRAALQGKVLPAEEAKDECADRDNCRAEAARKTGRVAKVEIVATGVEFLN